jgi:CheY-like chemotaxis protein
MTKPTILIVEDDDWIATQQQKTLEAAGYTVHIAPHALSAIVKVDEIHPHVLILDVLLTGTTGFALMHELQSYGDTGALPIILCTNTADELVLDELAPYGVKRILDKATMHPDDLVAAVRSVLA